MCAQHDPEASPDLQEEIERVLSRIIDLAAPIFALLAIRTFYSRFRARRHPLTTLGLAGSLLCLAVIVMQRVATPVAEMILDLCVSDVYWALEFGLQATSTFLAQLHLLLKMRITHNLAMKHPWSWLQIVALMSLMLVVAAAVWTLFEQDGLYLHFNPAHQDFSGTCALTRTIRTITSFLAALVINNVLCCVLFLDSLFTLITGRVESTTPLRRASAMTTLILLGRRGIRYLPKERIIIMTELEPPSSFSSHQSVREQRDTKILLARRAFLGMLVGALVAIAIWTMFMCQVRSRWVVALYFCEPALAWLLTALACPVPQESEDPLGSGPPEGLWNDKVPRLEESEDTTHQDRAGPAMMDMRRRGPSHPHPAHVRPERQGQSLRPWGVGCPRDEGYHQAQA